MTNNRKILFISDLHLQESEPEITQQFLRLLSSAESADALYILGDLFEVWIGDDEDTLLHREIIQALKKATQQGLPIYFLPGNRDFLIGKQFLRATGCQLLPDEAKISVYATPVLLMHGDTLCTHDIAYLKARKKARNFFLQKLFLSLPLAIRKKIATKMRAKSKQYTQATPLEIMDVNQEEVVRVMQKHAVNYLIHGHTHRPAFHEFSLNHTTKLRMVLGAWHERGNMLIWDASGKKSWIEF